MKKLLINAYVLDLCDNMTKLLEFSISKRERERVKTNIKKKYIAIAILKKAQNDCGYTLYIIHDGKTSSRSNVYTYTCKTSTVCAFRWKILVNTTT